MPSLWPEPDTHARAEQLQNQPTQQPLHMATLFSPWCYCCLCEVFLTRIIGRMIVELPGHFYCFPVNLEDCVLRPDLVIWNPMFKQILLFELTIPLEENIVQDAQFKESRYKPLREKLI